MKQRLLFCGCVLLSACIWAVIWNQVDRSLAVSPTKEAREGLNAHLTPTERRIKKAETMIRQVPATPRWHNQLAAGFLQLARETGDFRAVSKAEQSLKEALLLDPHNFEALVLKAQALVMFHEFSAAFDLARQAERIEPESAELLGVKTDCLVELGKYPEAVKLAQRMIDLRPDAAAYARAAHLRYLHGDVTGAIEAMEIAVRATPPRNAENYAWNSSHLGQYLLLAGKVSQAEQRVALALQVFPNYPPALLLEAQIQVLKGNLETAIRSYQHALDRVPTADTAVALGNLFLSDKRVAEAQKFYELADFIEQSVKPTSASFSRSLVLNWADRGHKLSEALAITKKEVQLRQDIFTLDTLAWCEFRANQLTAAQQAIEQALRLGTPDPLLLYHAGVIYLRNGDKSKGKTFLQHALRGNLAAFPLQFRDAQLELSRCS